MTSGPERGDDPAGAGGRRQLSTFAAAVLALSPYAVGFTVYGLLLDHLPDDLFGRPVVKYVLALFISVSLAMGIQLIALFRSGIPFPPRGGTAPQALQAARDPIGPDAESVADIVTAAVEVIESKAREGVYGDRTVLGWPQRLNDTAAPTAMGTAYGLRIALAFDLRGPRWDRYRVTQDLLAMQRPKGGWSSTIQRDHPRPEVTAWVLSAIGRAGIGEAERRDLVTLLEKLIQEDPIGRSRTAFLSTCISTLAEVAPDSAVLPQLVSALSEGADRSTSHQRSLVAWGPSLQGPPSKVSAAHTARAVVALDKVSRFSPRDDVTQPLVTGGINWLCQDEVDIKSVEEQLRRPLQSGSTDLLIIGHFTAAWVARAIMCQALTSERWVHLRRAVTEVLAHRDEGVWKWQDESSPIWMTYQGLIVLRDYGLRVLRWPPSP